MCFKGRLLPPLLLNRVSNKCSSSGCSLPLYPSAPPSMDFFPHPFQYVSFLDRGVKLEDGELMLGGGQRG